MSTQKRIDGVRLKIERAEQHIRDLEAATVTFLEDEPYRLGARPHPVAEICHTTLYITEVKPVPARISLIVGDAIHNLRSALDHVAWQLLEAAGGTPDRKTCFPICETPQQYASAMGNREIQKIPADARKIMESVQPYSTFDQTFWLIHHLDIVDKHRLLLTTVAAMDKWGIDAVFAGTTMWFTEQRFMPLIVGNEVVNIPTSTYDQHSHEHFKLGVDVAFAESQVTEGELVLYTVKKMSDFVHGLVFELERFLV